MTHPTESPQSTDFPQFSRLPPELRVEIWKQAASANAHQIAIGTRRLSSTGRQQELLIQSTRAAANALLLINHESRYEALQSASLVLRPVVAIANALSGTPRYVDMPLFDPCRDRVVLKRGFCLGLQGDLGRIGEAFVEVRHVEVWAAEFKESRRVSHRAAWVETYGMSLLAEMFRGLETITMYVGRHDDGKKSLGQQRAEAERWLRHYVPGVYAGACSAYQGRNRSLNDPLEVPIVLYHVCSTDAFTTSSIL